MWKLIDKLIASGLWLMPITLAALLAVLNENGHGLVPGDDSLIYCILLSLIPTIIFIRLHVGAINEDEALTGKAKAMYPVIPERLLYDKPTGIVLGKDKRSGKYVCKPLSEDGHVFLIGGSGSGKSSAYVIPALLANKDARIIAIDIKGELSYKSAKYGDEHVLIFSPQDRNRYGYDPLYSLNGSSTSQQIMEAMQNIAYSLIQMPPSSKDGFWILSARNLLLGLLIHYYRQGTHSFIGITDKILGRTVKESIEEVMSVADPSSLEYRYIVQFSDMADETLSGITTEMENHLHIFSNDQDIRYALRDNPNKANPLMIEEGYSIYLSVPENKLTAYYDLLQLIINQTLAQLEQRSEDSEPVIFVIDELPRILSAGKLDRLLDGARTLRSRKVCLYLITQSTEALMSAYTENEVADLISNCPYVVVLSASSTKTQKSVCQWCGKYRARRKSWSGEGRNRKASISFEERDIVEPSDLMVLKNTGEAIIITPYGYGRVSKTPYYSDRILKPMAEEIAAYNKAVSGGRFIIGGTLASAMMIIIRN